MEQHMDEFFNFPYPFPPMMFGIRQMVLIERKMLKDGFISPNYQRRIIERLSQIIGAKLSESTDAAAAEQAVFAAVTRQLSLLIEAQISDPKAVEWTTTWDWYQLLAESEKPRPSEEIDSEIMTIR